MNVNSRNKLIEMLSNATDDISVICVDTNDAFSKTPLEVDYSKTGKQLVTSETVFIKGVHAESKVLENILDPDVFNNIKDNFEKIHTLYEALPWEPCIVLKSFEV